MATSLAQSVVENILELRCAGVSIREIARRLGVHRETVGKYFKRFDSQISKSDGRPNVVETSTTGTFKKRTGPRSRCEPFRELIIERVNQGLTAQQIFQYLVNQHGFNARYYSVRRYVAKLFDEKRASSTVTIDAPSPQTNTIR